MKKRFAIAVSTLCLLVGCASGKNQTTQKTAESTEPATEQLPTPEPATTATTPEAAAPAKTPNETPPKPVAEKPTEPTATDFNFDLYRQLKSPGKNLFFSPLSVSVAMSMTYGGARGETEKQIAAVMGFDAQATQHQALSGTLSDLGKSKGVQLHLANALWPADDFPIGKDYSKLVKQNYRTPVKQLDYKNKLEKSRKTINKWASKKTKKKIAELLESGTIDALTKLVLTNAIYFKGNWQTQFKKKDTYKTEFWYQPEKSVEVQMMLRSGPMNIFVDHEVQVVEIPYMGERLAMIIVLPHKPEDLVKFEKKLTTQMIDGWADEMSEQEVMLYLPRFELKTGYELQDHLKALGMVDPFDGKVADFSGMLDPQNEKEAELLYISKVIHKAVVEVNEAGTEAAAATAVAVRKYGMPTRVKADRPFVFVIRDKQTKQLLFIGRLSNPGA